MPFCAQNRSIFYLFNFASPRVAAELASWRVSELAKDGDRAGCRGPRCLLSRYTLLPLPHPPDVSGTRSSWQRGSSQQSRQVLCQEASIGKIFLSLRFAPEPEFFDAGREVSCSSWDEYAPNGRNYRQTWKKNFGRVFSGLRGKWAWRGLRGQR